MGLTISVSRPPTSTMPSGVLPPSSLISILLGSTPPLAGLLAGVLEAAAALAGSAAGLAGVRVAAAAAAAGGAGLGSAASFAGLAAADFAGIQRMKRLDVHARILINFFLSRWGMESMNSAGISRQRFCFVRRQDQ